MKNLESSLIEEIPKQPTLADLSQEIVTRIARTEPEKGAFGKGGSWFGDLTYYAHRSGLHEPVLVRNQPACWAVAQRIIDEKGEVDRTGLAAVLEQLEAQRYCLDPFSVAENEARAHFVKILNRLQRCSVFAAKLSALQPPAENLLAQQRIRETLGLPERQALLPADVRRAALTMLLSYFRQNVGSCFATAPGIVIQRFEPDRLLDDLDALFTMGKLERYFKGAGLEVPLNRSVGVGDFKRSLAVAPKGLQRFLKQVAQSPAIAAGLDAAELLMGRTAQQRIQQVVFWWMLPVKQYLNEHLKKQLKKQTEGRTAKDQGAKGQGAIDGNAVQERGTESAVPLSMAQLLRWLALQAHGVSEQALQRHRDRPKPMVHDGVLIQNPLDDSEGAAECEACLNTIEVFEAAFKRFGENPLLKSWEYTVASLTDNQSGFTKTNLYHSLGVDPDQPYGLGHIVESSIQALLDRYNDEVVAGKSDHQRMVLQANQLRQRLNITMGDSRFTLELEYNKLRGRISELEIVVQAASRNARYLARLFNELLERYFDWFADYFQEVYDPDLHTEQADQYADAPAGFRLYFKSGRADSSQWLSIEDERGFIHALQEFFRSTESVLLADEPPEMYDALRQVVTQIMQQLQRPEFIRAAEQRLMRSQLGGSGSNALRKPWAYVSGGSVGHLVGAYLKLESLPKSRKMILRNATELYSFLVQQLRFLQAEGVEHPLFLKEQILCSPTHAFVLQGWREPFLQSWQQAADPNQWLVSKLIQPTTAFFANNLLPPAHQHYLLVQLSNMVLIDTRAMVSERSLSAAAFCQRVLQRVRHPHEKAQLSAHLGGLCYQQLPLTDIAELLPTVGRLLDHLSLPREPLLAQVSMLVERCDLGDFVGSEALQRLMLMAMMVSQGALFSSQNWPLRVAESARAIGLSPPAPLIFADSNWFDWVFAWVAHPATGALEVWQCNALGHNGRLWPIEWGRDWELFV